MSAKPIEIDLRCDLPKEGGRSGADAPSGCQPSASAASADATASSQSGIPNADTFRKFGVSCDNCRFGYHWAETRHRWEDGPLKGLFLRRASRVRVPYAAEGIQCFRLPIPVDSEADYWCGEYQPASGIEAATADETRSGSAEGESPAPEGGDAQC